MADQQNGNQGDDADQVEDERLVEDQVIVQAGQHEHQDEADDQPADLFHVHAGQGAAVRGGIDFDHAERADGRRMARSHQS